MPRTKTSLKDQTTVGDGKCVGFPFHCLASMRVVS